MVRHNYLRPEETQHIKCALFVITQIYYLVQCFDSWKSRQKKLSEEISTHG